MGSEYLQKLSEKLSKDDIQVIEKKYAEKQIEQMDDTELLTKVAECLLRIHIITGWNLPDDKNYIQALTEEFMLKLKEDFFMMNFIEVVYAFRKNGLGIKDWGKNMNLDLVCNVLGVYCEERTRLSMEEESLALKKNPPVQKIYTDEEILNQRRGHIEIAYQAMRSGNYPILHIYFPEVLHMDGLIPRSTDEAMNEFFVDALGKGIENIYIQD